MWVGPPDLRLKKYLNWVPPDLKLCRLKDSLQPPGPAALWVQELQEELETKDNDKRKALKRLKSVSLG